MIGHEGAIVCLASNSSYIASSSADLTVRLWTKHTTAGQGDARSGQQVRVVYGHVKSVLSLQLGETWMLSGSTDSEIRLWTLTLTAKKSLVVDCSHRLQDHDCPVTCVRYGTVEVNNRIIDRSFRGIE